MEIQISPFAGLPAMAPALLLASHPQPAALSEDSSGGKLSEFAEIPKLISRRRTTLTCARMFLPPIRGERRVPGSERKFSPQTFAPDLKREKTLILWKKATVKYE